MAPDTRITTADSTPFVQAVEAVKITGLSGDRPEPVNAGVKDVFVYFWQEVTNDITPGVVSRTGSAWAAAPAEQLLPGRYEVLAYAVDNIGNEPIGSASIRILVV